MKATLKLNDGREIAVDVSEETLKQIEKPMKKTGYEKKLFGCFYSINSINEIVTNTHSSTYDDEMYQTANYYSDKTIARNNARADALKRKLRRFAVEHRESELAWNNPSQNKWEIYYYYTRKELQVAAYNNCQSFGNIYFDTAKTAEAAIEEFKDELIWYFTEYKDSL